MMMDVQRVPTRVCCDCRRMKEFLRPIAQSLAAIAEALKGGRG